MRLLALFFICIFSLTACDKWDAEGPKVEVKYNFSTKTEFHKYYLPLQNDHGGIKSWVPAEGADCLGGKVFTLADGFKATFCPANGDESLFK